MVILWPLCRSHQLICPPAIQATLHWQSPATAQICLVPTIPRTPSRPLHRCLSCKVLSCNRCPTASCRVTPASGTLRTSTNLSPLCPVGPGWSHYRRFVKVLESCLHTLLMHPSSGRDTTSWTIFLSDIFIFSVERCLFPACYLAHSTGVGFIMPQKNNLTLPSACIRDWMSENAAFHLLFSSLFSISGYHQATFTAASITTESVKFWKLQSHLITGFGCFSFSGPWP